VLGLLYLVLFVEKTFARGTKRIVMISKMQKTALRLNACYTEDQGSVTVPHKEPYQRLQSIDVFTFTICSETSHCSSVTLLQAMHI
jgi:hypothetical protein